MARWRGASRQTDNKNLRVKLALRSYFLKKFHSEGEVLVADCCAGKGVIWSRLREEYRIDRYVAMDKKGGRGVLKIDSTRFLEQPGWTENFIDIDPYGSPWAHWRALLPNVTRATTVVMTYGQMMKMIPREGQEALGLDGLRVPLAILGRLTGLSTRYLLCEAEDHGLEIVEAMEAPPSANAIYIGCHLRPKEGESAA